MSCVVLTNPTRRLVGDIVCGKTVSRVPTGRGRQVYENAGCIEFSHLAVDCDRTTEIFGADFICCRLHQFLLLGCTLVGNLDASFMV